MKLIAIIDYGMCNLDSVARAVERVGGQAMVTDDPRELGEADGLILPGVGAFPDAMRELQERGLVAPLRQMVLEESAPFLGICLGMQLMASRGFEGEETAGLDLIPGEVVRLMPDSPQIRIPHIGWNEVHQVQASPLLQGIRDRADFYFVHSYHLHCAPEYILARTPYCGGFAAAVGRDLCFGVQFHPEKSLKAGLTVLHNFLSLC
jgi:glutamine amidotransferase